MSKAKTSKRQARLDAVFLLPEQKRLQGHERSRAIVSNLSAKGLSVAEIAEVTGYTIVAVEHHLEIARRPSQSGNGRG